MCQFEKEESEADIQNVYGSGGNLRDPLGKSVNHYKNTPFYSNSPLKLLAHFNLLRSTYPFDGRRRGGGD